MVWGYLRGFCGLGGEGCVSSEGCGGGGRRGGIGVDKVVVALGLIRWVGR